MRNLIFCISTILILNGCAQYSSLVGPSYTLVDTGSVMHAAINYSSGKYIENETGKSTYQHVSSAIEKKHKNMRFDKEFAQLVKKKFNEKKEKKFYQDLNQLVETKFNQTRKKLIQNN